MTSRTALITGANRGLGLEIARQLAAQGHRVLLGARDPAKGEAAAAALRGEVVPVALDVARDESVHAAARAHPEVDILVNNAAIYLDREVDPLALDPAILRRTLEVNTLGAFRCAAAWGPGMRARGWGRIVNMSSGMGQLCDMRGGSLAYRLSKTSLNALTRVLAHELAPAVKVNAMSPGWVRTDMGGPEAPRPVEEGADTAVWLATLPDDGPSGGFFRDRSPLAW
jgi:NAD(P)-dependent dehydrogenase (short-subunit alcohol dehydrogenase family)